MHVLVSQPQYRSLQTEYYAYSTILGMQAALTALATCTKLLIILCIIINFCTCHRFASTVIYKLFLIRILENNNFS